MKKLLYMVAGIIATTFITTTTSCKFAPDQNDGDTVAASEFYPEDTAALHAKKVAKTLFPHMTVFENVAFGLRMQKTPAAEITPRVMEYCQRTGYPSARCTGIFRATGGSNA